MSGRKTAWYVFGALALLGGIGTSYVWPQATRPGAAASTSAPAATTPDAIARINDKYLVNKQAFYDTLMLVAGPRVFQEEIDHALVLIAAKEGGMVLSGARLAEMVAKEKDMTMKALADQSGLPNLSEQDKQNLLIATLNRQGITGPEFNLRMEQSALLRQMAVGAGIDKASVTKDDVDAAFESLYGPKRQVHVVNLGVKGSGAMSSAGGLLKALGIQPGSKTKITKEDLEKALNGEKLHWDDLTIAQNATEIQAITDVAFKTDEGLMSPVIDTLKDASGKDNPYAFILWVEKAIPADPTKVGKKNDALVRDELTDRVLTIKQQNWMTGRMNELRANQKVEVFDPMLTYIFSKMAEAASQPASAPAIGPLPATMGAPALPGAQTHPAMPPDPFGGRGGG